MTPSDLEKIADGIATGFRETCEKHRIYNVAIYVLAYRHILDALQAVRRDALEEAANMVAEHREWCIDNDACNLEDTLRSLATEGEDKK